MKIFFAVKQIEFVLKMFAAAGFTNFAAAFEAKNENALKDFLAQTKAVEKIVEKVIEPSDEQLTALVTAELREHITGAGFTLAAGADPIAELKAGLVAHQSLLASNHTLVASLVSAGVKLPANATAEQITKAIDDRVSLKAAELTAKLGTLPIAAQVVASPAEATKQQADKGLTGLARAQAAFEADFNKK